jgi:hypothetical protein
VMRSSIYMWIFSISLHDAVLNWLSTGTTLSYSRVYGSRVSMTKHGVIVGCKQNPHQWLLSSTMPRDRHDMTMFIVQKAHN